MSADLRPTSINLAHEPAFRLGGLEVRPAKLEVVAGERREVLEPRVMQVLVAFARQRGEVVSREDLIQSCWGGRIVGEDAINRCVFRLRKLAEQLGGFELETVPRVGYRLSEAGPPSAHGRPRRRVWIASAALLLAAGLVAGWWWFDHSLMVERTPAPLRVAVMPFEVAPSAPRAQAVAQALSAEILGALSSNQVEAVSASQRPAAAVQGLGDGVGVLLRANVIDGGQNLKVRVRLDDARDGVTLWSRTFEASADDADGLERRAAGRVSDIAKRAVSPSLRSIWDDHSLVAAYLEASDEMNNEAGGRVEVIARDLVARAPRFGPGHQLLAEALLQDRGRPADWPGDTLARAVDEAGREARTALRLDPANAASSYGLLAVLTPVSALGERERLFKKALDADPDKTVAAIGYGFELLAEVGRNREAVVYEERALAAEPYSVAASEILAGGLMHAGRPDEAARMIAEARRNWPDYWELPYTDFSIAAQTPPYRRALDLLDHDPAIDATRPPLGRTPASAEVWRAVLHAGVSDNLAEKRAAAVKVTAASQTGVMPSRFAIGMLAALGDVDGAFREADRTYTPEVMRQPIGTVFGTTGALSTLFAPATANMRRDPRFMVLATRLGLAGYWRASGRWPDFCADPSLPYDCKAEAARLAEGRPR